MKDDHIFDVRVSATRRAVIRLVIATTLSIGLIAWGVWLLPESIAWKFTPDAFGAWDVWGFVGLVMIGSGVFGLIKETVFGVRTFGRSGHWHLRLSDSYLTWDVPSHAHGEEVGFRAALSEISAIEFRTIQRYEQLDVREYWVHFHDCNSLQLQSYSGVSLPWLVSKIKEAGVEYREVTVEG